MPATFSFLDRRYHGAMSLFRTAYRQRHPVSIFLFGTIVIGAISVAGASAQTRLYVLGESALLEFDTTGRVLRTLPVEPDTGGRTVTTTADGRYVAWLTPIGGRYHPTVLDTISGTLLDIPDLVVSFNTGFLSDPRKVRLFLADPIADVVWVLEPHGVRPLPAPGLAAARGVALGADGRLFYAREADVGIIDIETGAALGGFTPVGYTTPDALAVTADGRHLYVGRTGRPPEPSGVVVTRHETATGALEAKWFENLGAIVPLGRYVGRILLDEARDIVLVQTDASRWHQGFVHALDTATLHQLASWSPGASTSLGGGITLDLEEPRAYALSSRVTQFGGCSETRIEAFGVSDLRHLGGVTALGSAQNTSVPRFCGSLGIVSPPSAPKSLSAVVSGTAVTVEWLTPASGVATDYQMEVGSAPGEMDLLVSRLGDTRRVVANAPPGVYYVRLRAVNAAGAGAPSSELRIVVP